MKIHLTEKLRVVSPHLNKTIKRPLSYIEVISYDKELQ